jgi:hypothetical protein
MKAQAFILLSLLFSVPLCAQESGQNTEPDAATQRENPASPIPCESGKEPTNTCEDRWSDFLPIWGKAACERGYVLPHAEPDVPVLMHLKARD